MVNGHIHKIVFQNDQEKDTFRLGSDEICKDKIVDGEGAYAIPGLIDLHFHGCMGYDFCDGTIDAMKHIAGYEASIGVTAIVPASMTLPEQELEHVLTNAAEYQKIQQPIESDFLGINMEGPFISRRKKGAQDERNIVPPNVTMYKRFQNAANGLIRFIGIAPEEGDFEGFIKTVKEEVNVSIAHTNADYDTAKAAFEAGANHVVHLYNAMSPFTHREPGVIGAAADSMQVMAELICDGVHIHPAVVRATFQMFGSERLIFISDSMRAAGMPDGIYKLGGLDVRVCENKATLLDGTLAGSVTTLPDCMRIVVKQMKLPLETAVACVTENPARSIGVFDRYGSISVGKKAHVVLLDSDLNLKMVIKDGCIL